MAHMAGGKTKRLPINEIRTEPGAQELVRSERMKPYLALLKAQIGGQDTNRIWLHWLRCRSKRDTYGE